MSAFVYKAKSFTCDLFYCSTQAETHIGRNVMYSCPYQKKKKMHNFYLPLWLKSIILEWLALVKLCMNWGLRCATICWLWHTQTLKTTSKTKSFKNVFVLQMMETRQAETNKQNIHKTNKLKYKGLWHTHHTLWKQGESTLGRSGATHQGSL